MALRRERRAELLGKSWPFKPSQRVLYMTPANEWKSMTQISITLLAFTGYELVCLCVHGLNW